MQNGRDHVGRFAKGGPPGPGRPRNGVRAALARIVDFDELARYVYGVATDPEADPKDRQWAIAFITDRLEGKSVSQIQLNAQVAAAPRLPPNWTEMNQGERDAWIARLRAGGALALAAASNAEEDD
jgi:hypothetical protein